jgi:SAM-dependent methyltransferase
LVFNHREYWESRLREHFTPAGVGYLRLGRRFNEWMYRVRGEVFDRAVGAVSGYRLPVTGDRLPVTGHQVLDVGPGTGFYVERWRRLGAHVTGLDLTAVSVERLSERFPDARFVQADIGGAPESIPLEPGSFQAISAFDVLFHIVDDAAYARAFRNIARLLAPGGWFIWSDNFLHDATSRVAHQASRPLAESERLLEAAGLAVERRMPMFVLMNYPADTRSRLPRWLWTAMVSPAMLAEPFGWLLGATLYPLERVLVRRLRESPSTELMICRKREQVNGER